MYIGQSIGRLQMTAVVVGVLIYIHSPINKVEVWLRHRFLTYKFVLACEKSACQNEFIDEESVKVKPEGA